MSFILPSVERGLFFWVYALSPFFGWQMGLFLWDGGSILSVWYKKFSFSFSILCLGPCLVIWVQGVGFSKGLWWCLPSDENVLQPCGTLVPVPSTMDWLPPCWCSWAIENPNLQGRNLILVFVYLWSNFDSGLWFLFMTHVSGLCGWHHNHVHPWKKSKYWRVLW